MEENLRFSRNKLYDVGRGLAPAERLVRIRTGGETPPLRYIVAARLVRNLRTVEDAGPYTC